MGKSGAKEIRFKDAGVDSTGRKFDFVVGKLLCEAAECVVAGISEFRREMTFRQSHAEPSWLRYNLLSWLRNRACLRLSPSYFVDVNARCGRKAAATEAMP